VERDYSTELLADGIEECADSVLVADEAGECDGGLYAAGCDGGVCAAGAGT
jgi:hypothetical protein